VLGAIGAGGMGEVYRARDPRLQREVAVKILPPSFSSDQERLHRFEREAHAAAALNHPNILAVYDIGTQDGSPYIVSELLEGESLRERLRSGPLSVRKAIECGLEIARGLAAAHDKGIVHRDLKPENIFFTRDGRVKLLDFGLAKLTQAAATSGASETMTVQSNLGSVVGTMGYMSPEQVRGKPADARSDLFAFGVVLYEMISGKRAFHGETPADTMSAILHSEPPELTETNRNVAPALQRIVVHCLEKNPEERFQSMRDVIFDLDGVTATSGTIAALPVKRGAYWLNKRVPVIASIIVVGALTAYFATRRSTPAARVPVAFQQLTDFVGMEESPAISPDGKAVAFSFGETAPQIWVRLLASGPPLQITRDESSHFFPRWAPDSASLIYFSPSPNPDEQGTISEIPALGGAPRRLASAISGGDLSHDGKHLVYFRLSEGQVELVVTDRDGSNLRRLARLAADYGYWYARWSPDDRLVGYQRGRIFSYDVFAVPSSGGEPQRLTRDYKILRGFSWLADNSGIVYSSSRGTSVLYLPTMNLWSVKLDGSGARQLTFGEASYVDPDLDSKGRLPASRIQMDFNVWRFPVSGSPIENVRGAVQVTHQTAHVQTPSLSPGDRELAYLSDSGGHGNLWVMKLGGSDEVRQITFEQDPDVAVGVPVWSPDGRNITFFTRRPDTPNGDQWLVNPDGSNRRRLTNDGGWAAWSPDGKWLYVSPLAGEGKPSTIIKLPVEGGNAVVVRTDDAFGSAPAPDGRTLYFVRQISPVGRGWGLEVHAASPENGPSQLLARFPAWRAPVSIPFSTAGFQPVVSPDGKWLTLTLVDGSTTNLYLLPTKGGPPRQITSFGSPTEIARRVSWSSDSMYLYAAVSHKDADVVLLTNLLQ
jgi:eukaryotic-like serine/threonine-protein kinase